MSVAVPFRKMSGAGNDFIVVGPEGLAALGDRAIPWVRRVCRRRLSVGADGVLFVEPAAAGAVTVRFHNPDGSPAFCGNGSRCAARYAVERGFAGSPLTLRTDVGEIEAAVDDGVVTLTLPAPRRLEPLELGGYHAERIEAGVPHLVIRVDDVDAFDLEAWGPRARHDPRFGEAGTNLNVLAATSDGGWRLRTWERGVDGETLACGSGAVAAALVARLAGAGECVRLHPAGGVALEVELPGAASAPRLALLRGDARFIVDGEIESEATCGF